MSTRRLALKSTSQQRKVVGSYNRLETTLLPLRRSEMVYLRQVLLFHLCKFVPRKRDKMYDTSEMRKFLDNSQMPSFAKKPKIFFLQACVESQDQDDVDQADDDRDEGVNVDEADKIHEIPTDADCLLAYATTSGTYFLRDVYEVLKENYTRHHLGEMLISSQVTHLLSRPMSLQERISSEMSMKY